MTKILLAGAALVTFIASPLARADYASTVLSQEPQAYYRLNETLQPPTSFTAGNSGTMGASANGTYVGFPTRGLTGPFTGSKAIGLDGVGSYVNTPWVAGLNTTTNMTLELWVNPNEVPKFAYVASSAQIVSPRTGWYLAQDDGSTFAVGSVYLFRTFINSGTTPGVSVYAPVNPAGTWLHLVITYDEATSTAKMYTNGVLAMSATGPHVPNASGPTTIGCRSTLNFFWPGKAAEVAIYTNALSAGQISTHYSTANTTPANYASTVLADNPAQYQRYLEAIDPPAANASSLGSALNGLYIYDAKPGVIGPATPTYSGLEAANKATAFANGGGVVRIPPLNLNTNTVTISCWVNATNLQQTGASLVTHGSAANACGLTIDQISGGLGLGYVWNGNAYLGWSPTADGGLPQLPDSAWAYAALVIRPASAELYVCDANNFGNFASVTNTFGVSHASQAFASATLVGAAAGYTAPARTLNGAVDEVTIFKRALSAGELYTQYATAVGGVKPRIFADLQGPVGDVAAGDPIVLTVDAGGTSDLTFTWHKAGGGTIATTTNGVLTIASSVLGDAGTYDVTISNAAGSADSQTAVVTVITPSTPAITGLEGYRNRTLYLGATLRLAVAGTGGGLKYQWYKNASPIASATSSVYSVGVTNTSQTGSFSVSVTNSVGSTTSGLPVLITIPNMATNSYEGVVISSGPEAWWRLDEAPGSTNLFDGMGRHDGIYTNLLGNSPPVALGVPGALVGDTNTGATFSGDQGVGVIPYSPAFSPAKFTIEGWVRTTVTTDPNLSPFSSTYGTSGLAWETSPAGEWRPVGNGSSAPLKDNGQTNAVVIYNAWTHLVMAYDSSIVGFPWIYAINGYRATTSWSGTGPNLAGPFIIGGHGVSAAVIADLFWNGQVDEVAIYQRVLSNAEIAAHYAARGVEILPPTFGGPLLSQTVVTGKSLTFSTTVFGTAPVLSWYKGTPLASAPLATGTNALTFNPTALGDSGNYSLVASNSAGSATNTVSLTVISSTGYANVTNNLVLHLKFDGDTTDSSGRGNNATAVNSPTFVAGTVGSGAFHVNTDIANSISNYATLGATTPTDLAFGASGNFSAAYWIRLPAGTLPGDLPVLSSAANSYGGPGITLAPSYQRGGWSWSLNSVGLYGAANSINDGNWHCVITTFDRTSNALTYLDGVLVNSYAIAAAGNVDQPGSMNIGQGSTGNYSESGAMDIDDLGVWGRVLTALDAAQIESAGRVGRSFDTVAPVLPTLSISHSGGSVVLTYTVGTLVESADPTVPKDAWIPVAGAGSPWAVTPSGVKMYYSVRQ